MFSFIFFFVQNRFYIVPELQLSDLSTRRAHIKAGRGKMRGAVEENSAAGEAHRTDARQITAGERGDKPPTHSQNTKVMSLVLRQTDHGKKHGHKS